MINHCSNHYSGQENLSFQVFTWSDNQLVVVEIEDGFTISPQTLDVSNGADFCQTKESSFNMASRFFQPGIDLTRSPRSLASTGFQTNPMLSLSSTASSNLGGSFYLWWETQLIWSIMLILSQSGQSLPAILTTWKIPDRWNSQPWGQHAAEGVRGDAQRNKMGRRAATDKVIANTDMFIFDFETWSVMLTYV